ncbi:MAG: HD domain-containing protein [Nitrospirae bacterium]|nr:MAG: HD domain-containing protein [Nitrospirota bacterium]
MQATVGSNPTPSATSLRVAHVFDHASHLAASATSGDSGIVTNHRLSNDPRALTRSKHTQLSLGSHSQPYDGQALIADPIHGYISFTVPYAIPDQQEQTEKDLIDSAWMQRLRYIYQLQSAHWVYPAAEHSRFQHSLGAMHLAGRFAIHLYPTLAQIVRDVPSQPYLEELFRVAALVHDIGHGPFCHFFDHHYLSRFCLSHERIGQEIIRSCLGSVIQRIVRSPSGDFRSGERLDPDHVAYLILKDPRKSTKGYPRWLTMLQPILGGVYTADNFDYVLRDSYMCGVAVGPIDIDRLIHYTLITPSGLTLHHAGLPALQMFLNARMYLYSNVYYHRTTRAIDIHLQEIFGKTMRYLFPYNPLDRLDAYLELTDWSVIETVRAWRREHHRIKRRLGMEWAHVLNRSVKWKMAYGTTLPIPNDHRARFMTSQYLERHIRQALPRALKDLEFRIDLAHQDPRPINLLNMGNYQIFVYNAGTRTVEKESLQRFFEYLPAWIVQFRIFSRHHLYDSDLAIAAERVLRDHGLLEPCPSTTTH